MIERRTQATAGRLGEEANCQSYATRLDHERHANPTGSKKRLSVQFRTPFLFQYDGHRRDLRTVIALNGHAAFMLAWR